MALKLKKSKNEQRQNPKTIELTNISKYLQTIVNLSLMVIYSNLDIKAVGSNPVKHAYN